MAIRKSITKTPAEDAPKRSVRTDADLNKKAEDGARVAALKEVRAKLAELYEGGSMMPRLNVFIRWIDAKIAPPRKNDA